MKQFIYIGLMLLLISCNEKVNTPKSLVTDFFEIYEKQGSDIALNTIFQTNKYMINETNAIENLKESLISHINIIGNYHGYEIISEYPVGKSIKHYTCIVNYDKQPLRFNFTFYNANNSWVLYGLNFDNKIMDELDSMAKFHYY
ncbi:MAG: hypothetical protein LBI82_08500 [Dysgonamonadaceae bacterium]|jgi:hypothetical protein|nr:hypothetical protein [Dysgonamonadaceae bacterium]